MAALALGMVHVGTADGDIAETIVLRLIECGCEGPAGFESVSRMLCVALGLVFLGRQEAVEAVMEAIAVLGEPLRGYCEVTVESFAYAGTGNVLVIQKMLSRCCVAPPSEDDDAAEGAGAGAGAGATGAAGAAGATGAAGAGAAGAGAAAAATPPAEETEEQKAKREREAEVSQLHLMAAVVGISAVATGEPVGTAMCQRAFDHLLQYGEPAVRRAVPLAMGLLSVSNPRMEVCDVLTKLSHDPDAAVAGGAVFALGLAAAGTNNSRVAATLRQLSAYHARAPDTLFLVRIAQGLLHFGKGTLTLDPVHADRGLVSRAGLGAVLAVVHAAIDGRSVLWGAVHHYLLYYLAVAAAPRWLMTVDPEGEPIAVPVRVGGRVDTVGAAGTPARVTGFQTHETPVLVGSEERAELVPGGRWEAVGAVLEGIVVCTEREGWEAEAEAEAKKK
jgi:26S proteasome regulatory subunit N1